LSASLWPIRGCGYGGDQDTYANPYTAEVGHFERFVASPHLTVIFDIKKEFRQSTMAPSIEEPMSIIVKEIERNGSEVNGPKTNRAIRIGAETEAESNGETYTVLEEPLGTPRQLRVITIGAGAAGLNMARHIQLQMENVEHIIYEKNPEVGGTWYENK
jgi:hypothetical protein